MNRDVETPVNRDALLETLAAELTLSSLSRRPSDQDGGHLARSGTKPLERWPTRPGRGGKESPRCPWRVIRLLTVRRTTCSCIVSRPRVD